MTTTNQQKENENKLIISYLTLRKAIGILGILFPVILVLGSVILGNCYQVQLSISNYYHTNMHDVFVGYVCILSLFLFAYKGYETIDKVMAVLAGIFGLMIAFFPTSLKINPLDGSILQCNIKCNIQTYSLIGQIHLMAAGLFIICLCYFCLFLFTKEDDEPTPEKLNRNLVYKICGWIMVSCIVLLIIFFVLPVNISENLIKFKPVFFLETICFIAFGISWLIKGEFLLKDSK